MIAYVLFGMCVFAFLLVAAVSMVGSKDNSGDVMQERRDRLEERKNSGTVTELGNARPSAPDQQESKAA